MERRKAGAVAIILIGLAVVSYFVFAYPAFHTQTIGSCIGIEGCSGCQYSESLSYHLFKIGYHNVDACWIP